MIVARQGAALGFLAIVSGAQAAHLATQIDVQSYISSIASWLHCPAEPLKALVEKVTPYEVIGQRKISSPIEIVNALSGIINLDDLPSEVKIALNLLSTCEGTQLFSKDDKRCQTIEELSKMPARTLGALLSLVHEKESLDPSISTHLNKRFVDGYLHPEKVFSKAKEGSLKALKDRVVKDVGMSLGKDLSSFAAKCTVSSIYKKTKEFIAGIFGWGSS